MQNVHLIDRQVLEKLDPSVFSEGSYIIRYNSGISSDSLKLFLCKSGELEELGLLNHFGLECAVRNSTMAELRSILSVQAIYYRSPNFISLKLKDDVLDSLIDKYLIISRAPSRAASVLSIQTDYTSRTTPELSSPYLWSQYSHSPAFFKQSSPAPDAKLNQTSKPDISSSLAHSAADPEEIEFSFDSVFDDNCNGCLKPKAVDAGEQGIRLTP